MSVTYVVGHKNPDTDSVVSAIALAKLEGYTPAVAGSINKETEYVLKRFNFETPIVIPEEEKEVILVDHNSPDEMSGKIQTPEIKGIFDHHRLGGVFTADPVPVLIQTVGSTGTILGKMYLDRGEGLTAEIAGIIISAILSDTLNFSSPTTTEKDKTIAMGLNKVANVDLDELANEMFKAKSDISDVSTMDLLSKDYKVFEMNGNKVGFGVWETVLPDAVLERKDEIVDVLQEMKTRENLNYVFFAVVDIVSNSAKLILESAYEEEVAKDVFKGELDEGVMFLPGVVSRKKQMIPPLETYFSRN